MAEEVDCPIVVVEVAAAVVGAVLDEVAVVPLEVEAAAVVPLDVLG